ncbi:graves disease carrier protein-like [Gigantopelta aegis]|uniref:graves disease carrier protein-like n=1 Tax=Gigantopelta aegis TaxID=1735272 RepID=UPI001B88AAC1|nr:graves disease carrier protein-like [Gigantopelta aegis]
MAELVKQINQRKEKIEIAVKTFLSGGIAGCCAKTTVAPLDRVKILLQAHNQHYKHLGVFSTIHQVVVKEGFLGLYKGNGVQMLRIFPYAAIQFMSYEQYKKLIKKYLSENTHVIKLTAGSLAGLTAVVFTYPLDVVRARLAFQVKGEHIYLGLRHTVRSIVHVEGGTKALYRGLVPSILGMAPYAGVSFYSFEMSKIFCLEHFPDVLGKPSPLSTGGVVLILPAKLLCGGMAGAVAQTVSYPLDVVRRRLQLSTMLPDSHKYESGWIQTLIVIYKEHGMSQGLYRGLSVNYIRIMPMVAVSFTTYESIKQILGLDTGIDR